MRKMHQNLTQINVRFLFIYKVIIVFNNLVYVLENKDSNSKDDIRKLSQLFKNSNIEDALKYFSNIS